MMKGTNFKLHLENKNILFDSFVNFYIWIINHYKDRIIFINSNNTHKKTDSKVN